MGAYTTPCTVCNQMINFREQKPFYNLVITHEKEWKLCNECFSEVNYVLWNMRKGDCECCRRSFRMSCNQRSDE